MSQYLLFQAIYIYILLVYYPLPEETSGARVVAAAAGMLTLGTLRPKLLVVFILAKLTTEEVVLVADVGAVE